jgi:TnpA family transposase
MKEKWRSNLMFFTLIHRDKVFFGLSTLLGIQLMPRIRNWKDLKMFRPMKEDKYEHIDELFSSEIDWELIETHYSDMLRVAMSIKAGKITPSTILNKLGAYSQKNISCKAFRELGRVMRTIFLPQYMSDEERDVALVRGV